MSGSLRSVALVLSVVVGAWAGHCQAAFGGGATYEVLKCHTNSRGASEATADAHGAYVTQDRCAASEQRLEVTNNGFTSAGQSGLWRFTAPPGAVITGFRMDVNLRRDNHHLAQIVGINDQGGGAVYVSGPDTGEGFQSVRFLSISPIRSLVIHLSCADNRGCAASDVAHAYARNVEITVTDQADPIISSVSGSLLAGGWLRGTQRFFAQAGDSGSGLASLAAWVNGVQIGSAAVACAALDGDRSATFSPCPTPPAGGSLDRDQATTVSPYVNGTNSLLVCARDFAGNTASCIVRSFLVDNSPPALAFEPSPPANDPELVRVEVNEPHSGLASGSISYRPLGNGAWQPLATTVGETQMSARLRSSDEPSGEYEFIAEAADFAGNTATTRVRRDGQPMVLEFPLRQPVALTAGLGPGGVSRETVRYGGDGDVAGRLLEGSRAPLPGEQIVITEYFGPGALIDTRVRTTTTDAFGAWSSYLPPGPSRTVTVEFAGTSVHRPASVEAGIFAVRSHASFRASRGSVPEGSRVEFTGRVGHLGARMPNGGKLLELQVRERAGRWNTVREAFHTKPNGRYALGYRFGRFYRSDVSYRFRVKIAREESWPYLAPIRSAARTVTVRAR